jgi:hypothetical protein
MDSAQIDMLKKNSFTGCENAKKDVLCQGTTLVVP